MNSFFHKQFEEEFLGSERLRVSTLLGIFTIGIVFALFNTIRIGAEASIELKSGMTTIISFMIGMVVFELSMLLFIIRQIRNGFKPVPLWAQYLNAFVEISAPSVLMLTLLLNGVAPAVVMNSPIFNIYFVFIILSTLRLDFRISLFISIVGAVEFFAMSNLFINSSAVSTFDQLNNSYIHFTSKSIVILVTGLGAAFVAGQTRKKIDKSVAVAEKGNKLVNLFGQQVSKEIANEMLETNGEIPSKLMRVCVMFIDIRDFTSYVTGKTPAEIVEYQNIFFSIVINVVARHHGIINQFLGDGCMITFGAPVTLPNPSENAVKAAFEIRETIRRYSREGLIPKTNIGVGIHVGEAVTGNIGTELRQQYSITGSVVILAARIEQLNKEYKSEILTSAEVVKELNGLLVQSENLGGVQLKGWHEPVGIYKLA